MVYYFFLRLRHYFTAHVGVREGGRHLEFGVAA